MAKFYRRRNIAIREDLRKLGLSMAQTGVAAGIINVWARNTALMYAALMTVLIGVVI